MRSFNLILGVVCLFASVYYIFFPNNLITSPACMFSFIVFLWGICCIVAYCTRDKSKVKDVLVLCRGIAAITVGVISICVGVLDTFYGYISDILPSLILLILMIWLVIDGILCFNSFIQFKQYPEHKNSAILYLIISIVEVIVAILIFIFYQFDSGIINILTGIGIAVFGLRLLLCAFATDRTNIID